MTVNVLALTRAQWIFTVALGLVSVMIVAFGLYVASSTLWANRWYRRPK